MTSDPKQPSLSERPLSERWQLWCPIGEHWVLVVLTTWPSRVAAEAAIPGLDPKRIEVRRG